MFQLISSDPLSLVLLTLIVFVAGIVRGCIGFAFSALVVASGALFLSPSQLVPMVVLLEVVASVQMIPKAYPSVHWRAHNWLLSALVCGTPVGVYALSIAPEGVLRLVVSLVVLLMASVMMSGFRFAGDIGRGHLLSVGLVAGLFNGIAAIGGMPIAVYLSGTSISMAQIRATLVMLFFGTEAIFIVSALLNGIYNSAIMYTAVLATIPMAAGIWLGSHIFDRVDEQKLRKLTISCVFCLAVVGLVRAAVAL